MLKSTIALLMIMLIVTGGSALAQYDGVIGLYFDEEAQFDCADAADIPPYAPFAMYLVVSEADFADMVAFEVGQTWSEDLLLLGHNIPFPYIGVTEDPFNILAFLQGPVPIEGSILLGTFSALKLGPYSQDACFQVHGCDPSSHPDGLPVIMSSDQVIHGLMPNHGEDAPCQAWISVTGCEVATETQTWEGLKSLYR